MKKKPCITCGTDPTGDLHPRQGPLCFWCAELAAIRQANIDAEFRANIARLQTPGQRVGVFGSGDLGPMLVKRGSNSTGPRRAPPIPTKRVRQHHDFWDFWGSWYTLLALILYVVFMVAWMRMSA